MTLRTLGLLVTLTVGLLAACATIPPEQAAREALMLEAAKECEGRFATVRVQRVDQYGRVWFTYGSPAENQAFLTCYQSVIQEKTRGAPLVSPGRLALPAGGPTRISVPTQISGGRPIVEVTVNESHRATLLVDTGASTTLLSPAVAERVGISPPVSSMKQISTVVGGKTITYPLARVRSLRIGDFAVEEIDVGVYDAFPNAPSVQGILGATFLNHFRVTVDQAVRQLTLEVIGRPSAARSSPDAPAPPSIRPADPPRTPGREQAAAPVSSFNPPVWKVGDEWAFRWQSPRGQGTFVWAVVREEVVDGIDSWVVKGGQYELYYRKVDLAFHLEKFEGVVTTRHVPPAMTPWPLVPGSKWERRYTRERPADRQTEAMWLACEVGPEEQVTVLAGTFRAVRIACRNQPAGSMNHEVWFSPELKHMVRDRTHFPYGVRERELTTFRIK